MIELQDIMRFAIKAHDRQMYGEFPYSTHLSDVYGVLLEFEILDKEILFASWLHDTLEDTHHSYNDVKVLAGENVAEIVYAVTDELGRNRKERHEKTWPKIKANEKAMILKQAYMVANIRMGIREKSSLRKMYRKEYPAFREFFYPLGNEKLWNELDILLRHENVKEE